VVRGKLPSLGARLSAGWLIVTRIGVDQGRISDRAGLPYWNEFDFWPATGKGLSRVNKIRILPSPTLEKSWGEVTLLRMATMSRAKAATYIYHALSNHVPESMSSS
jgi:hypothetical protein